MRIVLGRSVALVSHRPRHAEVDQKHTIGFEPNNQILAAPLEGCDGLSLEFCCDLAGLHGPGHAWIENLDAVEAPTDEEGLETNANRLDLGQLGHGASLARASRDRSGGIGETSLVAGVRWSFRGKDAGSVRIG